MPPYVERKCPKTRCRHLNTYDLAELSRTYLPLFAHHLNAGTGMREFAVTCSKCGHEFVIRVPESELRHGK